MNLPKSMLFFAAIALASCAKPIYSTDHNLDFEYAKTDSVPAQWIVKNATVTGYSGYLDTDIKQHGKSSLRIQWDTIAMLNSGGFQNILPGDMTAGKQLEVSGWIKTQDLIKNGYANLFLVGRMRSGTIQYHIDTLNAVRGTTDWTHFTTKMNISDSVDYVTVVGVVSGKGIAWFDNIEILIDGKLYKDRKIPALKTELTDKDKQYLRKYVYPLRTCEPDGGDTRDLDVLKQLIGESRVVGLGECTHGTSEIYKLKDRIVRYLVTNNDFNLFSLEADMPACYKINDYTVHGTGDVRQAIRELYLWPWWTEEMLSMVEWMKRYNDSKPRITFTGVDMQFPTLIMPQLLKQLENCPAAIALVTELSGKVQKLFAQPFDKELAKEADAGLVELAAKEELSNLPKERKMWVQQYIDMLRRFMTKGEIMDWRDRGMVENLQWIIQQNSDSRVLLWAHDLHIGRNEMFPMGTFLKERFGNAYLTFGFATYTGKYTAASMKGLTEFEMPIPAPGTLEYVLGQLDEPIFILDIRKMREENAPIMKWIDDLQYREIASTPDILFQQHITKAFDYLIFIRDGSVSHQLKF